MKNYTLPEKQVKYFVAHREKKNQPWGIHECQDLIHAREVLASWEHTFESYMKKKTWEVRIGTKIITHEFA